LNNDHRKPDGPGGSHPLGSLDLQTGAIRNTVLPKNLSGLRTNAWTGQWSPMVNSFCVIGRDSDADLVLNTLPDFCPHQPMFCQ
jgi:hypothetical protein